MESLQWSEQKEELFELNANTIVSASAGTGKTTTLTELIVRWLESDPDDHSLQDLVAITFTERAAGEMKQRLQEFILDRLDRGEQISMWENVRRSLPASYIGTIHSFCTRILRENAIRFGLDPNFSVLDEREAKRQLSRIINSYLINAVQSESEGVREMLRNFGFSENPQSSHDLKQVMQRLLQECWNNGLRPDTMRRRMEKQFRNLPEEIDERVDECIQAIEEIVHLSNDSLTEKSQKRVETFRPVAGELKEWLRNLDENTPIVEFSANRERAKSVLSGNVSKSLKTAREPLRRQLGYPVKNPSSKTRGALQKMVAFQKSTDLHKEVFDSLVDIERQYQEYKREQGYLDFHDLLFRVRDGLKKDLPLRNQYKEEFDLLLIDEFQDVNQLQHEILFYLSETPHETAPVPEDASFQDRITFAPSKFVVVGDPKQSIYMFRGADVSVFQDTVNLVTERGGQSYSFQENYRSIPSLLHFFNAFSRHLFEESDDSCFVSYDENDDLVETRKPSFDDGNPRIELLSPGKTKGASDQMRRLEAETIAERIEELTADDSPVQVAGEHGTSRSPEYGDIAILFRKTSYLQEYERALRNGGIPYRLFKGQSFFSTPEIRDMANLFTLLKNPSKPIPLFGFLKSPLVGVIEDTLMHIKSKAHRDLEGNLIDAFRRIDLTKLPEGEGKKIKQARSDLDRFLSLRDRIAPDRLVSHVRDRTDLDAVLSTGTRGRQAVANLDKLEALLREGEGGEPMSFFEAANYLRSSVDGDAVEEEAPVSEQGEELVQLMTIHSAKGLEFPIVMIADMGSVKPRVHGTCLFDRDIGIGMRWRSPETDISHHTWSYKLVREKQKKKEKAESLRLLYVAMTRARDYLLFSGWYQIGSHNAAQKRGTWWNLLDTFFENHFDRSLPETFEEHTNEAETISVQDQNVTIRFRSISEQERATGEDRRDESFPVEDALAKLNKSKGKKMNRDLSIPLDRDGPRTLHHTATEILELLTCPRRYAFLIQQNLSEDIGEEEVIPRETIKRHDWQKAGILAHRLLQSLDENSDPDPEQLRKRAMNTRPGRFLPDRIREEVVERVQSGFQHLLETFGHSSLTMHRERPFAHAQELNIEDQPVQVIIEGTTDLLLIRDDRVILLDYKYSHYRHEKIKDDRLQLLLYALAYRQVPEFQDRPLHCCLFYLREEQPEDGLFEIEPENSDLQSFRNKLEEAFHTLITYEGERPVSWTGESKVDPCRERRCGFIPFCWPDSS